MGIGLLAPLFLAGLAAIAIPVFVHLMHRERKDTVPFPSLMFLRQVPVRSARRQRIRYWLLFLLRVGAVVFIATAFARPWLSSPRISNAAAGGRDIIVLIDASYSMSARAVWARAQHAAADVVRNAGANDRVAVAAFGERARLLARWEDGRNNALAAVDALQPGSDVTRYAPALRLAGSLLAQSRGPAEIVWVTDRQLTGGHNVEPAEVPPNTLVRVIDVRAPVVRNLAVTHVRLAPSTFAGRPRVTPSATVINNSGAPANVTLELRVDGRVQQTTNVRVADRDSADAAFTPMSATKATGDIRIRGGDDIAIDDVAYFTIGNAGTPVVRVMGNPDAAFYFENALLAGDTSAFQLTRPVVRLSAGDLHEADVLVLLETAVPQGDVGDAIAKFVIAGGGLIVVAPPARARSALLPVDDQTNVASSAPPARMIAEDVLHPVFAPFRADGSEPFAGARVQRYVRSRVTGGSNVIARFDNGAPALVERRLGRGTVLFAAMGFSRNAGDFVLQPAFVPFVHQLVRYAAQASYVPRTFTVGHVLAVDNFVPPATDAVIATPAGERTRLPVSKTPRTFRVDQAGVYQIHGAESGGTTEAVAANVDASESNLDVLPASFLENAVAARPATMPLSAAAMAPGDEGARQTIWWYLLALAFALLAVDTLLSNRISVARRPGS